jgi:hypothetical protein
MGVAVGVFFVVLGTWQLFFPHRAWGSARRNTAWRYRDPVRARRLEPSQGWIFATRVRGVYTIIVGAVAIIFAGWFFGYLHRSAPDGRQIVVCGTVPAFSPTANANVTARPFPAVTLCNTYSRH